MASTAPTLTPVFDLLGTIPELRLMIFEQMENRDLCNMRLTCRQIFGETNKEFEKRFLNEITILGTMSKVKQLHDILRLPIVAQSKLRIRKLLVQYPTPDDLTIEHGDVVEDWLPSKESVRRLLSAIPNLEEFTLHDPDDTEEFQFHCEHEIFWENQEIAQMFLSALGALKPMASNLTDLTLDGINFDGLDLHRVLSKHSSSLRIVKLVYCELTGHQIDPATWDLIFHKLHGMELDELLLVELYDPDPEGPLVLHECSITDGEADNWSSRNPLHGYPPIDCHGNRHHFSDYEEADAADSCAVFCRFRVELRGSWVQKGLEYLLGKENHTLYCDPRDPEEILGQ